MRLVNHPFRLDSQRLLSYLTSMRVLTLAVTPAISTTFWNTIYFYTASATAGNLSYDCARGRHCTVSAAASRRHVDAFLDLFTRESPRLERFIREESSQRAPPFFVDGGSINWTEASTRLDSLFFLSMGKEGKSLSVSWREQSEPSPSHLS